MASYVRTSSTHLPSFPSPHSPSSIKPHFTTAARKPPTHFPSLTSNTNRHSAPSAALSDGAAAEDPPAAVNDGALSGNAKTVGRVRFENPKWVGGTWDLGQFQKGGRTDWDAVIDAEVKRRKWLEDDPESSSNDDPVSFDTSIIPWWAWMKRFHLPEAELLNGRAAMVGFFMAYFVDSLTGVGLVDQMGNFFCKTLLFISIAGVLLVRKKEDVETLKKLIDEITFYDRQWRATWRDETTGEPKRD